MSSTASYDSLRLPSGLIRRLPLAASTLIHAGVLCGINAAGYLTEATPASVSIVGWSADQYDNSSGSNGDIYGEVELGVGTMENKSGDTVGITDIGRPVFVSTTSAQGWYEIQKTAGASPLAGFLFGFEAESGKPLLDVRPLASQAFDVLPVPTAVNATATLTAAVLTNNGQIFPGYRALLTSTTAAAVTMTTPTGTLLDAAVPFLPIGAGFHLTITNTGGTNAVTLAGGTDVTIVGLATVAALTTGSFFVKRTAANTYVIYRL